MKVRSRKICTAATCKGAAMVPLKDIVVTVVALAQAMAERKFYPYQVQLAYRVVESLLLRDGDTLTALFARQSGKTDTVSSIVASLLVILPVLAKKYPDDFRFNLTDEHGTYRGFKLGVRIGIYAPRMDQASIMYERTRAYLDTKTSKKILQELKVSVDVSNGTTVKTSAGSRLLCESASEQSKIEGETHDLLVCEECQDITDIKLKKCFSGDTEFLAEDGSFVSIKQIVGQHLKVLGPKADAFVTPAEYHDNGAQEVTEIITDSGKRLKVTAAHRNLVVTRTHRTPFVLRTSELEVGHRIAVPDMTPVFGTEGSKSFGYFLGSILGDGCVSGSSIQFIGQKTQWRKLDAFARLHGCCASLAPTETSPGIWEGRFANNQHMRGGLIPLLKRTGVWGLTGKQKHIPNRGWSREFLVGLIEGLFETDGSVERPDTRPCISFANISIQLVTRLRDYLLRFGIHATIHNARTTSKGLPGLSHNQGCDFFLLHIKCVQDILRFADLFDLGVKQSALTRAAKWASGRKSRQRSDRYPSYLRFERIKEITKLTEEETYCVTVPTEQHLLCTKLFVSGNSLHPMVSSRNGTIVKIGTATSHRCDFYDSIKTNERGELAGGPRNHFFYPYQVCEKFNSLYRNYIEKEKVRIGETSDEFLLAYSCQWLFERGMYVTQEQLFHKEVALVNDSAFCTIYPYGLPAGSTYSLVVGIDWGRMYDSTVLTVMAVDWENPVETVSMKLGAGMTSLDLYRVHIINWIEWKGDNYEVQYHDIVQYLHSLGPALKRVVTDSNTAGQPIFDRLASTFEDRDVEIVPFNFQERKKSDAYKAFYAGICGRRVTFPASKSVRNSICYRKFIHEMLELRKSYKRGIMHVAHPDLKGAHDDFPDSAVLAYWGTLTPPNLVETASSTNNFFS